jgi:hypothetical protein
MDTLLSAPEVVNRPRRTVRTLYRPIDIHSQAPAWPDTIPPLTETEAIRASQRLYEKFYRQRLYRERGQRVPKKGKAHRVKINRRIRYAKMGQVNPEQGWRGMVHSLSHQFHWYLRPKDKPHSDSHRHLEKEMIAHVVNSGWLDGKLKPKPRAVRPAKPKPDPIVVEHEQVIARLKAWKTKAKRAATAIAKLRKQERSLARRRAKTIRFSLDD